MSANARKKKTLETLKRLTQMPPPPESDSEDLSEAEESVTAAVLSDIQRTTETVQPRRTGRKRIPKTRSD